MSSGPRARDRELFEILLDTEVVPAGPLEQAQREALTTGRPLWRILFRDGLCKEDDLFQILNQSVRAPVLAEDQLKSVVVPEELRAVVGPELAQRLGVLPLERSTDGRRAAMAMVDPTADLSTIWNQLVRLGIAEVRRFLLHAQTFRLGFEVFYGRPYEPDDASPPETLPELPRPEEKHTRREASSPRVMLDPSLAEEMQQLEHQPAETSLSSASTPVLHPVTPTSPAAEGRSLNSQETPRRPYVPTPEREPAAPSPPPPQPTVQPTSPAVHATPPAPHAAPPVQAPAAPVAPLPITNSGGIPVAVPAASSQSTKPPPMHPAATPAASSQSTKPPPPSSSQSMKLPPPSSSQSMKPPPPSSSQSMKPPPPPIGQPHSAAPTVPASATVSGGVHIASAAASSQSTKPPPLPHPLEPAHAQAGAPNRELAVGGSGTAQQSGPASSKSTRPASSKSTRPLPPPEPPVPTPAATPAATPAPAPIVTQAASAPASGPVATTNVEPVAEPLRTTSRARRDVSIPELSADEFFEDAPVATPTRPPVRTSRPPGQLLGSLRPLGREFGLELAREFSKDADLQISVPALPVEKEDAKPSTRSDGSGASALFSAFAPSDPAQEALLATCLSLLSAYEEIVGTSRAALLSRLSQAAADRLGFTTRASREVCLVAWLYGILTARVQAKAAATGKELPATNSDGRLGFDCDDPLQSALESLQLVLVDFMRLPGEQDVQPIGIRLIRGAEQVLDFVKSGVDGDSLRNHIDVLIEDSEVSSAMRRVAESELQSLGITAEAVRANPEGDSVARALLAKPAAAGSPAGAEKAAAPVVQTVVKLVGAAMAPALPLVTWETERLDSIDALSSEGLEPHPTPTIKSQ